MLKDPLDCLDLYKYIDKKKNTVKMVSDHSWEQNMCILGAFFPICVGDG